MTPILAYDIAKLSRNPDFREAALEEGLDAANSCVRFADAGKRVIRAIHALPTLWDDKPSLAEVEVYIGRSGATPGHVYNRWKSHFESKGHRHGMVVLTCDTDVVGLWESAAVRTLKGLHRRRRLCVKNASATGEGKLPELKASCIYLTWAMRAPGRVEPAERNMLDELADEVADEINHEAITLQHMRRALDPLTRPVHERADVMWHPDHEED